MMGTMAVVGTETTTTMGSMVMITATIMMDLLPHAEAAVAPVEGEVIVCLNFAFLQCFSVKKLPRLMSC